eukprot:Opistho-2@77756
MATPMSPRMRNRASSDATALYRGGSRLQRLRGKGDKIAEAEDGDSPLSNPPPPASAPSWLSSLNQHLSKKMQHQQHMAKLHQVHDQVQRELGDSENNALSNGDGVTAGSPDPTAPEAENYMAVIGGRRVSVVPVSQSLNDMRNLASSAIGEGHFDVGESRSSTPLPSQCTEGLGDDNGDEDLSLRRNQKRIREVLVKLDSTKRRYTAETERKIEIAELLASCKKNPNLFEEKTQPKIERKLAKINAELKLLEAKLTKYQTQLEELDTDELSVDNPKDAFRELYMSLKGQKPGANIFAKPARYFKDFSERLQQMGRSSDVSFDDGTPTCGLNSAIPNKSGASVAPSGSQSTPPRRKNNNSNHHYLNNNALSPDGSPTRTRKVSESSRGDDGSMTLGLPNALSDVVSSTESLSQHDTVNDGGSDVEAPTKSKRRAVEEVESAVMQEVAKREKLEARVISMENQYQQNVALLDKMTDSLTAQRRDMQALVREFSGSTSGMIELREAISKLQLESEYKFQADQTHMDQLRILLEDHTERLSNVELRLNSTGSGRAIVFIGWLLSYVLSVIALVAVIVSQLGRHGKALVVRLRTAFGPKQIAPPDSTSLFNGKSLARSRKPPSHRGEKWENGGDGGQSRRLNELSRLSSEMGNTTVGDVGNVGAAPPIVEGIVASPAPDDQSPATTSTTSNSHVSNSVGEAARTLPPSVTSGLSPQTSIAYAAPVASVAPVAQQSAQIRSHALPPTQSQPQPPLSRSLFDMDSAESANDTDTSDGM